MMILQIIRPLSIISIFRLSYDPILFLDTSGPCYFLVNKQTKSVKEVEELLCYNLFPKEFYGQLTFVLFLVKLSTNEML